MTSPGLPNHADTVDLVLHDRSSLPQNRPAASRSGQPERPLRIAACNTAEGWARDVTAEIAQEVLDLAHQDLFAAVRDFVEWAG
jgi:hypothetical protein